MSVDDDWSEPCQQYSKIIQHNTYVHGINDLGVIVGYYSTLSGPRFDERSARKSF